MFFYLFEIFNDTKRVEKFYLSNLDLKIAFRWVIGSRCKDQSS